MSSKMKMSIVEAEQESDRVTREELKKLQENLQENLHTNSKKRRIDISDDENSDSMSSDSEGSNSLEISNKELDKILNEDITYKYITDTKTNKKKLNNNELFSLTNAQKIKDREKFHLMKQKFQKKLFILQTEIDNLERSNHFMKQDINNLTIEKEELHTLNKHLYDEIQNYKLNENDLKIEKIMIHTIYICLIGFIIILWKIINI